MCNLKAGIVTLIFTVYLENTVYNKKKRKKEKVFVAFIVLLLWSK